VAPEGVQPHPMSWSSEGRFAAGGCGCAGLITLIVCLAISFQTLDQLDYGLNYNSIGEQIEAEVYEKAGLYFLGVGHSFIRYPKTIQTMEFVAEENDRLQTRTSDGLPVKLSISFQFRYDPGRLLENYLTYKGEERVVYENVAKATIANVATNFTAYTFFNDKQGIATSMQIEVTRIFSESLYALVDAFQITQVELPSQFQQAILDTIQAKQNITTTLRYKENMAVTFNTQVIVANQTRLQTVALAYGTAAQRTEEATANVAVTRQSVLAEMYAYGNLTQQVASSFASPLNASEILDYIWWNEQLEQAERGAPHKKDFLVGVDPAVLSRS